MPSLSDFDIPQLADLLAAWGHPRTHAAPLLRHVYNTAGDLPDDGRIGPTLLARLRTELSQRTTTIVARRQATDGTVKLLVRLPAEPLPSTAHRRLPTADSSTVECVLMPSHLPDRAAGCVSSQVGCAMGCDFCASTKAGVERSLTAGEIVEQFLHLRREALALGRRLRTLVFMGMGEPMLNYDNVAAAIRRIAGDDLGALGFRHVTVSTVGIVPGIDRLRTDKLGVHLAVSLHAPDDDTRAAIVPTGRRYKVADILAAVRRYQADSGQIATIEYTLLDGVNDTDAQAQLLADLLNHGGPDPRAPRAQRPRVNLIPYNAIGPGVSGREYRRPPDDRVHRFLEILRDRGVVAHARRTRGHDIDGACGQLRETVAATASRVGRP